MSEILKKILTYKRDELEHEKRKVRFEELKDQVRDLPVTHGFLRALRDSLQSFAIIAEVKQRSPSKGILRDSFDPLAIADDYARNGAACLSILTDQNFFGGHLDHLRLVREQLSIPLLRKDFIWDPYQIYAAREAGADAVLLIAAMLEIAQMEDLQGLVHELGMDALIEVHEFAECEMAQRVKARLVGVNNRDLRTFEVDVSRTERLLPQLLNSALVVSESGLDARNVLERLKKSGVGAFLIGESLLKCASPGKALKTLLSPEEKD